MHVSIQGARFERSIDVTHAPNNSTLQKVWDAIADLFCGTHVAEAKKQLCIFLDQTKDGNTRIAAFLQLQNLSSPGHKGCFLVTPLVNNPSAQVCFIGSACWEVNIPTDSISQGDNQASAILPTDISHLTGTHNCDSQASASAILSTDISHLTETHNRDSQTLALKKLELISQIESHSSTPKEIATKLYDLTQERTEKTKEAKIKFLTQMILSQPKALCHAIKEDCEITFSPLEESKTGNVCHNFSFDSLDSNKDSDFSSLQNRLHFPMKKNPELVDVFGDEYPDWAMIVDFDRLDGSHVQCYQGDDQVVSNIRVYSMEHSAREVDGRVFHKFNGISALFSIPGHDDLWTTNQVTNVTATTKPIEIQPTLSIKFTS